MLRWVALGALVAMTAACEAQVVEEGSADGAPEKLRLDPTAALPEAFRDVTFTMNYETAWVAPDRALPPDAQSVALIVDGTPLSFRSWCVDQDHSFDDTLVHRGTLYSSYEPLPSDAHVAQAENLDLANYIISKHPVGSELVLEPDTATWEITDSDMQAILWELLATGVEEWFDKYVQWPVVDAVIAEAYERGESFVPGPEGHALLLLTSKETLDGATTSAQTLALDAVVPWPPPAPPAACTFQASDTEWCFVYDGGPGSQTASEFCLSLPNSTGAHEATSCSELGYTVPCPDGSSSKPDLACP